MTLNDNPRVTAEKRFKLLWARLDRLNARYQMWLIDRDETGAASRLVWTGVTGADKAKADRVRKVIFREIRAVERVIKSFK